MSMQEILRKTFYRERPPLPVSLFLRAVAFCYAIPVRLRNFLYDIGLLPSTKLPCRAVVVGNITVGGSGKTPLAAMLAESLRDQGLRVAVLTRGYRAKKEGKLVVASEGSGPRMGPDRIGDEPYMLAQRLKDVPVILGGDRIRSGRLAVDRFNAEVVVLDDGFQHRRLARDLDLVAVGSTGGFGTGRLLPAGPLREPFGGLARAHLIAITGNGDREETIRETLAVHAGKVPVIRIRYRAAGLISIDSGQGRDPGLLSGRRVLVFSGLGMPEGFEAQVASLGAEVVQARRYPDHYRYSSKDIRQLGELAERMEIEYIVTTKKDAVKIDPRWTDRSGVFFYLEITLDLEENDRELLGQILHQRLGIGGKA